MEISFNAFDYTAEDRFVQSTYTFRGKSNDGWIITRNRKEYLRLGPGHQPLRTMLCGVCSTDLARRHLPYPLPHVIGHEAVALDQETGSYFVPEINDTCLVRGDSNPCVFCRSGLPTHCPDRLVLGIDRLPGAFGSWMLVPAGAMVPIGDLPPRVAVLAEPLAAALHAVSVSPPSAGSRVAVVGAGRLGLLIVAVLAARREAGNIDCTITAIEPREKNRRTALELGADESEEAIASRHQKSFTTVFESSGSPDGMEIALACAREEIHLKSTHGRAYRGIRHLSSMVVDEISLLPDRPESFDFTWEGESRRNQSIYVAPAARLEGIPSFSTIFHGDIGDAENMLESSFGKNAIPCFDIAVASTSGEIDACIRPSEHSQRSLVRPRGAIVFRGEPAGNPLLAFIAAGGKLRTTRCGDIRETVSLLISDQALQRRLAALITHVFPASRIGEAFVTAARPEAIKVLIDHRERF